MGLYSGGLIIGRIFASEILGANFWGGVCGGGGGGGGLFWEELIGILRYFKNAIKSPWIRRTRPR